ncbi:MAG: hypothetical protein GXP04_06735 [Alphaproteobacteria bacterium]|nr:hypothetical protein [Marinicaulis sp.]NOX94790.1 hypothetical protein [Alphaproteobacteria bacterium]
MKINPLYVIAGVFAASFAGRAIGIADAALNRPDAEDKQATVQSDIAPPAELMKDAKLAAQLDHSADDMAADSHAKPVPALAKPVSASHQAAQYTELMAAIRDRSATLDTKATEVEDRIRILEILEERIAEKLSELEKSNVELSNLVNVANEASQGDITMLARMYEQMKPQRAGEIFNKMNPTFAAGFLTEMNSENAALVLTNMTTDKAYEASMIIASRNAAVHQ